MYRSILCAQLILPPITRPREVDFGPPIRKATCYLYNLPEVESTFETMRVPTVSARFSTAPFFWNWAMIAVARLAPRGFLEDRAKCASPTTTVGRLDAGACIPPIQEQSISRHAADNRINGELRVARHLPCLLLERSRLTAWYSH